MVEVLRTHRAKLKESGKIDIKQVMEDSELITLEGLEELREEEARLEAEKGSRLERYGAKMRG